jgi:predicted nucleotidyltransferase
VNFQRIEKISLALEEINDEVVFIGAAILGLYVTEEGADPPRITSDIDICIKICTYSQMNQIQERLAIKGFFPAAEQKLIYRFEYKKILVDFIPVEDTPLGPTNRWLKPGFGKAERVKIGESAIFILPVSYYLATKWEAFRNRGFDYRLSPDFEDIVYILDNNSTVVEDIFVAEKEVRQFLKDMSEELLSNGSLSEILECHLVQRVAGERSELIIDKLKKIASYKPDENG